MRHIYSFKDLTSQEKQELVRFPVYLSLLAASKDHTLDKKERDTAVKLTHIKSFACDPILADYYAAVEKEFASDVSQISDELPVADFARELAIKRELNKLRALLMRMDREYAIRLYDSLRSYTYQVARAHRSIVEYFLFPLPIGGYTD